MKSRTIRVSETIEHVFTIDDIPDDIDADDANAVKQWADQNGMCDYSDGEMSDAVVSFEK